MLKEKLQTLELIRVASEHQRAEMPVITHAISGSLRQIHRPGLSLDQLR